MPPLYQQQPKKVTITWQSLRHQHRNNEYNVDNNNYNNIVSLVQFSTISTTHT